ncbi:MULTISPECIES: formyltransferase family protein [Gammaproteobacteria]|uniref:formyltransferase family protein n=1 Tax=Gammaproteobacteria TaxID=1236 RepID=UPI000DCFA000|nr:MULTISPECIES: formyltransferase family protein [Gammaproteobacteria]RTE86068.1 formyl transferase [Aliidiomarina sp. B3213]TCZ91422.1 formyl transferase [Lysobacter sp. N42]
MKQVGFIGCVESSWLALSTLMAMDGIEVVAVVTRSNSSFNADFKDLTPICRSNNIPFICVDESDQSPETFLKRFELDLIYCIGWSEILRSSILNLPKDGVIGFHPAKLPRNRGRHPIIWALALGLKETASTFFLMDEGADSGPIINQRNIVIEDKDCAGSLYKKILNISQRQIAELTEEYLNTSQFSVIKQDSSVANYWRKRSRTDGIIDWRMPAKAIHDLIRALAAPYPNAEFIFKETYVKVSKSWLENKPAPRNIEPGKVVEHNSDRILIKCGGESSIWIRVNEASPVPKVGEYL